MSKFPKGFVWGAASSAIQIEGSPAADGGGRSVWDEFCSHKGHIYEDADCSIACDAYHRYEEDLDLLASMGLKAYRFSASWARIDPAGDGNWNQAGLAYYDKVIDACLKRGIEPYLTLHHWELPQAVEDRGGWLERKTAEAFARYAGMCAAHFGDRVRTFFTMNEPQIILGLGHRIGLHAPGKKLPEESCMKVWKNLLLALGLSHRAVREAAPQALTGFVPTGNLCYGSTESEADRRAAERATFTLEKDTWTFNHALFCDPVFFGTLERAEGPMAGILEKQLTADDWKTIHFQPDILGVNVYNGHEIRAGEDGNPVYVPRPVGHPVTALKWPVTPKVMHHGIVSLWKRYQTPIVVAENGLSCNDKIYLDGKVHDADRIDFLTRYLNCLAEAPAEADIRGYFHWSLTDNFEWHSGYGERFGLIYIDYPTQRRIPKDSAAWFGNYVKNA